MKHILIILFIYVNSFAFTICPDEQQECRIGKIDVLDTKKIALVNKKVNELSALAVHKNILYLLSDKGRIFHFDFSIKNKKIAQLRYKDGFSLKDKKGQKLSKELSDSEGMEIYKDKLLISFEGKNRVEVYDFYGNRLKNIKLNKKLRKNKDYQGKNKGLESVAYCPLYGVLTAPEQPLKNRKKHKLYSKDFIWKFNADGSITDLKFIDTHRVIVLMRDFSFLTRNMVTSLIRIDLSSCIDTECKAELLGSMKSSDGWKIDNFEGIAKVGENLYLMVSDDNDSFFQKTLLVLFEITED